VDELIALVVGHANEPAGVLPLVGQAQARAGLGQQVVDGRPVEQLSGSGREDCVVPATAAVVVIMPLSRSGHQVTHGLDEGIEGVVVSVLGAQRPQTGDAEQAGEFLLQH